MQFTHTNRVILPWMTHIFLIATFDLNLDRSDYCPSGVAAFLAIIWALACGTWLRGPTIGVHSFKVIRLESRVMLKPSPYYRWDECFAQQYHRRGTMGTEEMENYF